MKGRVDREMLQLEIQKPPIWGSSEQVVSKGTRVSDLVTQQPAMPPLSATLFEQCMSQLIAGKSTTAKMVEASLTQELHAT